jgi:putative proteasome-type protease
VIEEGALKVGEKRRIEANDPQFMQMSAAWSEALKRSFETIAL